MRLGRRIAPSGVPPAAWGALAVLALALLALAGWAAEVEALTTFGVPDVSTKPVTAIVLGAAALAALLPLAPGRAAPVLAVALAGVAFLAGLVTLAVYLGLPVPGDDLPGLGTDGGAQARMSPLTSAGFVLLGPALAADALRPRPRALAQAPALGGLAVALLGLLTLTNRAVDAWGAPAELQLGLPTVLGQVALALVVVFRPPLAGPAAAILAPTMSGLVLRAALPVGLALAVVSGVIEVLAVDALGLPATAAGIIGSILILATVMAAGWQTAGRLRAVEEARAASERRTEAILAHAPVAIVLADARGRPTRANGAWYALTASRTPPRSAPARSTSSTRATARRSRRRGGRPSPATTPSTCASGSATGPIRPDGQRVASPPSPTARPARTRGSWR